MAASFVMDGAGPRFCLQNALCSSSLALWSLPEPGAEPVGSGCGAVPQTSPSRLEQLFRVLVCLGARLTPANVGFERALLGLSGGIDSAPRRRDRGGGAGGDHVEALLLPSPYSSEGSRSDAPPWRSGSASRHQIVRLPLDEAAFDEPLSGPLQGAPVGLTAENLQSLVAHPADGGGHQQGQLLPRHRQQSRSWRWGTAPSTAT